MGGCHASGSVIKKLAEQLLSQLTVLFRDVKFVTEIQAVLQCAEVVVYFLSNIDKAFYDSEFSFLEHSNINENIFSMEKLT